MSPERCIIRSYSIFALLICEIASSFKKLSDGASLDSVWKCFNTACPVLYRELSTVLRVEEMRQAFEC